MVRQMDETPDEACWFSFWYLKPEDYKNSTDVLRDDCNFVFESDNSFESPEICFKLLKHWQVEHPNEIGALYCYNKFLYSDVFSIDDVYKTLFDKTKQEFEEDKAKFLKEQEKKQEENIIVAKANAPEVICNGLLYFGEEKRESWAKYVNDAAEGGFATNPKDVIKIESLLTESDDRESSFKNAKDYLKSQMYSGFGEAVVLLGIREFCTSGVAFDYYYEDGIMMSDKEAINRWRQDVANDGLDVWFDDKDDANDDDFYDEYIEQYGDDEDFEF